MKFEIINDKIKIYSTDEFNPVHIFECGQVFAYRKINNENYIFYPDNKVYLIYKSQEKDKDIFIIQQVGEKGKIEEAIELFDLNVDYKSIKDDIFSTIKQENFKLNREIIKNAIEFGYGIRILNQGAVETIISFVFSQNNNIRRIKNSLDKLREKLGKEIKIDFKNIENRESIEYLTNQKIYSFPDLKSLSLGSEDFFKSLGAGYRAKYLVKVIKSLNSIDIKKIKLMTAQDLRKILIELKGVGRKVADCILLFGFGKRNVFPVDTWICQAYSDLICSKNKNSAIKISNNLELQFGKISGYIQQYLFYYKRSFRILKN